MTEQTVQYLTHAVKEGHAGAIPVLATRAAAESRRIREMRDTVDYCAEYRLRFRRKSETEQVLVSMAWQLSGGKLIVLPGRQYLAAVGTGQIEYRPMVTA